MDCPPIPDDDIEALVQNFLPEGHTGLVSEEVFVKACMDEPVIAFFVNLGLCLPGAEAAELEARQSIENAERRARLEATWRNKIRQVKVRDIEFA